jgi:Lrp/AsnC family transcriptional regulator, regulator for asnA, asnC and gidA
VTAIEPNFRWTLLEISVPNVSLDEIDRQIIMELRKDGRMAYGKLGKLVGLSEAAVRQRVHKLRNEGILLVSVVLNVSELGYDASAYLGIRCNGDPSAVARKLAEVPEIDYVITTAGMFDVMAEIHARNSKELSRLLADVVRPIDGISEMYTNLILNNFKLAYEPPLDTK